jgi:predicted NBD/HSP70 family sugar kinase
MVRFRDPLGSGMTGGESETPTLAIDLGGTKTLVALVSGARCLAVERVPTHAAAGPAAWFDAVAEQARPWSGRFERAAIAVSGLVADGRWWALNPRVLPIPPAFPLEQELARRLGVPVVAVNDAQAAAWGEHRFGAGQGADLVFLTISTGVGGGIVLNGRLITGARGLAGHIGRTPLHGSRQDLCLEDVASGQSIARQAAVLGHPADTVAVFEAAAGGQDWAETLIARSAGHVAWCLASLQILIDPACFVIGGGVGLAPGYLDRVRTALAATPELLRPAVRSAALGVEAGLIGIADYARSRLDEINAR